MKTILFEDLFPVENLLEVVCFGVGKILTGSLVVGGRDVVHDVVDIAHHLVAVDVDKPWRNLARGGILQVAEEQGADVALMVDIDHAAGVAFVVKFVDAHAHHRAIGQVEGNGGMAADFVADFHRTRFYLQVQFFQLTLQQLVEEWAFDTLPSSGWPCSSNEKLMPAFFNSSSDRLWNTPSEIMAAP